jgi:hypothetical protein
MTNLAQPQPNVTVYEDDAGSLYLLAGERIYRGLEHLDAGSGLTVMLAAAAGLEHEHLGAGRGLTWEPVESYFDGDGYRLPGEPVAQLACGGFFISPDECGPTGRRLLGLPPPDGRPVRRRPRAAGQSSPHHVGPFFLLRDSAESVMVWRTGRNIHAP